MRWLLNLVIDSIVLSFKWRLRRDGTSKIRLANLIMVFVIWDWTQTSWWSLILTDMLWFYKTFIIRIIAHDSTNLFSDALA